MELTVLLTELVGQPEGQQLEYKATLIPSKAIAQILAGFANAEGGILILGVREHPRKKLEIQGISTDFNVHGMVTKALSMTIPTPVVTSTYFDYQGKQLFGIRVAKNTDVVRVEGQQYIRRADQTLNLSAPKPTHQIVKFPRFQTIRTLLETQKQPATEAKKRLLGHYLNILKLYEPTLTPLFPSVITDATTVPEGKTFNRILFSSCVDNFETYLSELLYQIYIARPDTLKGGEATVRVAEVLDRADIEDFVQWYASKRVSKLQKGSIKGFLKENPEIAQLKALAPDQIGEIEKILQIRHLYAHRNGIIDEPFLQHFRGQYTLNSEHQLSIADVLDKLEYIVGIVVDIDEKAADKYGLSTKDP